MMPPVRATPRWVRVLGGLGALWNLAGLNGYLTDLALTPEEVRALPTESQEILAMIPPWLTPVALLSLGAALLGSIGLLLGRRWAGPSFAIALAANLPYAYFTLVMAGAYQRFGMRSVIAQGITLGVAAAFVWLGYRGRRAGWLS